MNKQNKNSKQKTQTTKATYSKVIHICCRTNKTRVCMYVCVCSQACIFIHLLILSHPRWPPSRKTLRGLLGCSLTVQESLNPGHYLPSHLYQAVSLLPHASFGKHSPNSGSNSTDVGTATATPVM